MKKIMFVLILCICTRTFCMAQSSTPDLTTASGIFSFARDSRFWWSSNGEFYVCFYNSEQINLYRLMSEVIPDGQRLAIIKEEDTSPNAKSVFQFLRIQNEFDSAFFFGWTSWGTLNIYFPLFWDSGTYLGGFNINP